MKDAILIVLGGLITLLTTHIANKRASELADKNEQASTERLKIQLESSEKIAKQKYNYDVILNNREYLPKAAQSTLKAMNELYASTSTLVSYYPHMNAFIPQVLFSTEDVTFLNSGIPKTLDDLTKLTFNWHECNKKFEDVLSENKMFFSSDIQHLLMEFKINCSDVKDYFYGMYGDMSQDRLTQLQYKAHQSPASDETAITEKVVKYFDAADEIKEKITNEITYYIQQQTKINSPL
ncbi:hypothetical protein [Weissella minor]|uniref:hypothetical protein n=1 Tax=Weissella minor TaxID=1620 RepID=UPI003AF209EB